jgi:hypothetical protein
MGNKLTKWRTAQGGWPAARAALAENAPLAASRETHARGTRATRRGVLLLVVLSLLLLFSMIAVTFVLVAGRYNDTTRYAVKVEQTGDDPRQLLDEVLGQCLRGTTNPNSVLRGHSLLEDMYGNDGIIVGVAGTPTAMPVGNEQILDVSFTPDPTYIRFAAIPNKDVPAVADPMDPPPLSLPQIETLGYYNGCVVTAVGGVADGRSTRILGWQPVGGTWTMRVLAFEGITSGQLNNNPPRRFIINGRPFNGTGFGFNPEADPATEPTLLSAAQVYQLPNDGATASIPYALLPNQVFNGLESQPEGGLMVSQSVVNGYRHGITSSADEDYDAPDPQNMLLAHIPLNASPQEIIPSLHRPDMINHIQTALQQYPNDGVLVDRHIRRQYQLRPSQTDHPQFPRHPSDTGPYDVDNDGDGIAESVWVDAGLPVRTAPDGRMYKPLVAILCLDLDGRLNVNAHGSVAQLNPAYPFTQAIQPNGTSGQETIANYLFAPGGVAQPVNLPRGLGFGPAEISLAPLFASPTDYQNFFQGLTIGGITYEGRYGEYGTTSPYGCPLPGNTTTADSADDLLVRIKRFGTPTNYYNGSWPRYGSPSDMWGRVAVGIDYAGQPVYSYLVANRPELVAATNPVANLPDDERPNDPYTVNLSRARATVGTNANPTRADNLFSVAELEPVLRKFDGDAATLPDRLRKLLEPTGISSVNLARLITTDSNDVPVPAGPLPRNLAQLVKSQNGGVLPSSVTFLDMVRAKLADGLGTQPTDPQVTAKLERLINDRIIAPELVAGRKMNLARVFGNGVDDDNNGIVDEPDEYTAAGEVPPALVGITNFAQPTYLDLNGNGAQDADEGRLARQEFAQQLYFLMMVLSDHTYRWAADGAGNHIGDVAQRELTTRQIAQWAVNVVDFCDADSIMTGFEYDVNPFNGWDVDGDLSTTGEPDRHVVWGAEQPELLITETLAFHDRRVSDDAVGNTTDDVENNGDPDDDFDQVRTPQGSLFLELYCPRSPKLNQPPLSGDLYVSNQLDLAKMADGSPVWRVAISGPTTVDANHVLKRLLPGYGGSNQAQPDAGNFNPTPEPAEVTMKASLFDPNNTVGGSMQVERLIWFCKAPDTHPDLATISVYHNAAENPALLSPGQFAVIGPRAITHIGMNEDNLPASQKILLNPAGGTVQVDTTGGPGLAINALNLICTGRPTGWTTPSVGMNISEPLLVGGAYYPEPADADGTLAGGVADIPFDGSHVAPNPNSPINGNWDTGTRDCFRFAMLQRLADPTRAYDPNTNPYITVDWQGIDLTVFNGQPNSRPTRDPSDNAADPPPASLLFGSRQRGDANARQNIWNPLLQTPTTTPSPRGTVAVFDYQLRHTLAQVNETFGMQWTPPATLSEYSHVPNPSTYPFPWLTWNNRPFISEAELLLVPAMSAEQMLRSFRANDTGMPDLNPFENATVFPTAFETLAPYHRPFKHLLNFRLSSDGQAGSGPNFARVLDWVHVPSPYVGTETVLHGDTNLPPAGGSPPFTAPYNVVPHYREPGRVNINTIAGFGGGNVVSPIWSGITRDEPALPAWPEIVSARRANSTGNVTDQNNAAASVFSRPFRSAGGAAYMLPTIPPSAPLPEVEATLLRQIAPTAGHGLFEDRVTTAQYANPTRNPYFHFHPYTRTKNLVTTRSNVYAIWITVGYFEVRPPIDASGNPLPTGPGTPYPDGYQLLGELGADTGEIKRHRAFYIYDRTIPVGFELGKDHNVANGVLLRRFIE